jgi:hypothetical protein
MLAHRPIAHEDAAARPPGRGWAREAGEIPAAGFRWHLSGKEGSISFLKKRNKKLLSEAKVFWFFFSKKNCFLTFAIDMNPLDRTRIIPH